MVLLALWLALFASGSAARKPSYDDDDDAAPSLEEKARAGARKFIEPWSLRNEIDGVWGLGPTFNENSCAQCHPKLGRSAAPAHGQEALRGMVLRLSVPGFGERGAPKPHPSYGDQLQNRSISARVPREGRAIVSYDERDVRLPDGQTVSLRSPRIEFKDLQFGPLGDDVMVSARAAPALFGLGLLEAVPESTILALAKRQAKLGLNGRPNYVWDDEAGKTALGRFGWKANQPNTRQQVAAAMLNDIGATSTIYPVDNCPGPQAACRSDPTTTNCGGAQGGCTGELLPEALPSRLEGLTLYLLSLAPPPRANAADPQVRRGERLFDQVRCANCHVPELRTGRQALLPNQRSTKLRPYTDLLLHDMGEALADNRPDFAAGGRDWRTAPLWGVGAIRLRNGHSDLLHDGRARNVLEAILWHGGEASEARERFMRLARPERDALVKFVESL